MLSKEAKTEKITARITEEEKQKIEFVAAMQNISVAQLLRDAVKAYIAKAGF